MTIVAFAGGYHGGGEASFDDDVECIGVDGLVLDGLNVSQASEQLAAPVVL